MLFEIAEIPEDAAEIMRPAFAYSRADNVDRWIELCRSGLAQFWVSDDGKYYAITEILDTPARRIFHMVASCGEFCRSLVDEAEAFAKANGCTLSITEGRPGWQRVLKDYKLTHVTIEKEL